MVGNTQQIGWLGRFTNLFTITLLTVLTLGTVIALATRLNPDTTLTSQHWHIIKFTLYQAFLSACISIILAIPVARALVRQSFWGRDTIIRFMGAPFLLPVIVAIFGLVAIWGRQSFINKIAIFFGLPPFQIYGLHGILIAHVFFNLPLAIRFILMGWQTIPTEQFRNASQLGFTPKDIFLRLELPMLKYTIPPIFLIIFLLCMGSFAVALTLGGGPKATTLELAIYQAIRFDADFGSAAFLGLIQIFICTTLAILSLKLRTPSYFGASQYRHIERWDTRYTFINGFDYIFIALTVIFLSTPLFAVILRGLEGLTIGLPDQIISAFITSYLIALCSGCLAITMALSLCQITAHQRNNKKLYHAIFEVISFLPLALSPFVMGAGLFIIVNHWVSPFKVAIPLTILINATLALPFAFRIIFPKYEKSIQDHNMLSDSLGLSYWQRFKFQILPAIKSQVGFAMGVSVALSLGDLGVITLFASPELTTLPLLMYRLMESYQMAQAATVALLLLIACLLAFWVFEKGASYGSRIN